jgi:hypothetical protein
MVVTLVCFSAVLFMSTGSKEKVYDTHNTLTTNADGGASGAFEREFTNIKSF